MFGCLVITFLAHVASLFFCTATHFAGSDCHFAFLAGEGYKGYIDVSHLMGHDVGSTSPLSILFENTKATGRRKSEGYMCLVRIVIWVGSLGALRLGTRDRMN
jgi:hypothetical protein